MQKHVNLYLVTKDCQHLFLKTPSHQYGLYRRIERKLTQMYHKALNDNLTALVQANLMHQQITHYINDLKSEMKKYESLMNNKAVIVQTAHDLQRQCYPFYMPNQLTQRLNEALFLTDSFIVLLMAAKNGKLFESNRTFISVKTKAMRNFFYILGRINYLSVKQFPDLTAKQYFDAPEIYPDRDAKKTVAILSLGFLPQKRGVAA